MPRILVTSYVNPDIDGVAGAVAYAEFLNKTGKEVAVGTIGTLHDEAKYMLDRFGFEYPTAIPNVDNFDEVILVDSSDINALDGKIPPDKVVEVIDHRKVHTADKFTKATIQIELVGAVATLIAEKFIQNNLEISKESATLLYAAIISNTLNFKSSVVTDRDKQAAEWLNQTAKLPDDFWKELFTAKSNVTGAKLAERLEGDFAWFIMGGKKVGIAQIEMIGGKELVNQRSEDIIQVLEKCKVEMNLDFVFLSIVDLLDCHNFFISHSEPTRNLLEKVLNVKFVGMVAETADLMMRKQITPLLKEALEKI